MRPALHHHQDLPSLMSLMFLLVRHRLLDRQIRLDFHQDGPQLLHLLVGERAESASRERSRPRSASPEPQLNPIPMSDGDDDQPPQDGRQRGPDRVIKYILTHKRHNPRFSRPVTVPDEDPAVVNPSSPSAGPSLSVEQRGRSRRQQRSRSRERAPPHVPPHAGHQPQPAAPPPGEQQIQPLATQGADE